MGSRCVVRSGRGSAARSSAVRRAGAGACRPVRDPLRAVDIAYHLSADEGWGVPDSHTKALDLLAVNDVIDRDLATRITGVARVRNRLARGYASVDHERLWRELPDGLDALDAYAAAIAAWLPSDAA